MESQALVDDPIEVLRVLEIPHVELRTLFPNLLDFLTQFVDVRGIGGEMVEDVCESNRRGICSRYNDKSRISTQPF